jgi:hypothetical protein
MAIFGSTPKAKSEPNVESDTIISGRAEQILLLLSLSLAVALVLVVGIRWNAYHWDFHMFYGAAREFAEGLSPYRGYGLSYYHPPLMLYIYSMFTLLPETWAVEVWYMLKLAALAGLFVVWHLNFLHFQLRAPTVLFFILAYGGTIYSDLVAGNVSIFEQLLLWLGFSQLLRERYLIFALCVIVAAQVKLTPVFFALLLIVACEQRQWRACFVTVIGFFALFSLNYWLQPELLRNFWVAAAKLDERGVQCTSFLALLRDISDLVLGAEFTQRTLLDETIFLAIAGAIGALSLWVLLDYRRHTPQPDQRLLICFSCFVFALVSPRFKSYTYILLLVPTLYLFRIGIWRRYVPLAAAIAAILVLFPQESNALPIRIAFGFFNAYLPLFATLVIWVMYLDVLRSHGAALRGARSGIASG